MTHRNEALQGFVDAAFEGFDRCARDPASRRSLGSIFGALEKPASLDGGPGQRLPVCSYLDEVPRFLGSNSALLHLVEAFMKIEPSIKWGRRLWEESASDNFFDGHANALIFGPGGLEVRRDVWLGATLMAPHVRYPDHSHQPEETYLVLSEGDFRHGESTWFAPGVGGSFYNPRNIKHAMRSSDRPLFAFWALWAGGTA
jgi:hypothetical protein